MPRLQLPCFATHLPPSLPNGSRAGSGEEGGSGSSGEDDAQQQKQQRQQRGKEQQHAPAAPASSSKQPVQEVVFLDQLWKSRGGAPGVDEAARKQQAEQDALEQLKRRREQRKFMSAKVRAPAALRAQQGSPCLCSLPACLAG